MRIAFLESGPEAIETLENDRLVNFRPYALHPDYEQQAPGAVVRGRAMEPLPFDGRKLGKALNLIRPPIPEFTIFGGMMVDHTKQSVSARPQEELGVVPPLGPHPVALRLRQADRQARKPSP